MGCSCLKGQSHEICYLRFLSNISPEAYDSHPKIVSKRVANLSRYSSFKSPKTPLSHDSAVLLTLLSQIWEVSMTPQSQWKLIFLYDLTPWLSGVTDTPESKLSGAIDTAESKLGGVQCAPDKLRPVNIIAASSLEDAAAWKFSSVCGLPLRWCWQIFIILWWKLFVWRGFLWKKNKTLATWWYKYKYTLCLRNLVHAQEAAWHYQEGGKSHQVLLREQFTQWALFSEQIVSIKKMFDIIIHAVSFYVAHTVITLLGQNSAVWLTPLSPRRHCWVNFRIFKGSHFL